jgi:transcriptional regulator with XRE-family HTH domain
MKLITLKSKAGMSQRKLAEISGVTHATICNLERGKRKSYSSTVKKLTQATGVDSIDW